VINLIFGVVVPGIDNMAHIGGLVTGAWLGVLFAPVRVQTMRSMWTRPSATGAPVPVFGNEGTRAIRIGGLLALGLAFLALWALGVSAWS
jgi:Rhomboid family